MGAVEGSSTPGGSEGTEATGAAAAEAVPATAAAPTTAAGVAQEVIGPERPRGLEPSSLRRSCAAADFEFATTAELPDLDQVLGQPRAVEAIEFAIGVPQEGFNLFALGPPGTGRHAVVLARLEHAAAVEPTPDDWAYVYNFRSEHRPRALRLHPGRGGELRRDMAELVDELKTALPTAFESEDHQSRRQAIDEEFKEREDKAFSELGAQARERKVMMLRAPLGVAFAPARDGEALSPEEYAALPAEERSRLQATVEELKDRLEKLLRQVPRWQRERRGRLRELQQDVVRTAVHSLIDELRERYSTLPEVVGYLDEVEQDVIHHAPAFAASEGAGPEEAAGGTLATPVTLRRYQVNLLVDRAGAKGAPLVYEDHPTFLNLCGRVEHLAQLGALITDFTLIKPGALHRANGGYLILDALELLRQPFAWDALKRALLARQLRIESLGQSLSLVSTVSLEPEPIPLHLKVVLVGERMLYYLLAAYDPDFPKLFKVAADFDDQIEWNAANQALFARLLAQLARSAGVAPLDRESVASAVEEAARASGDAQRLSLETARLRDLLSEADHWRRTEARPVVGAADIERAIAARERRADRLRERLREETLRGTLAIATAGAAVGQVNGLTVVELGDFAFGHPTRITARVRLGSGEVIDIEREVELGGPIHSKGVLILAGFVGQRYAAELPLSLAASLVFEQSYGGVEGDSASLAELCALLAAIAEVPVSQGIAVTGSVDQRGGVQAVGGVNEKIEGFFDLCSARGLDGTQGVVIPAANRQHLMLRRDLVAAVAAGRFQVWAVEHVDRAMELLTGVVAGTANEEGAWPEGTINWAIAARLADFAETRRSFGEGAKDEAVAE